MNWLSKKLISAKTFKITPQRLAKWSQSHNYELLKFAYQASEFKERILVVEAYSTHGDTTAIPFLRNALYDRVFPVMQSAATALRQRNLSPEIEAEIVQIELAWAEQKERSRVNWSKPSTFSGKMIDRSNARRLQQAKAIAAKFRGSMSID